MTTIDPCRRERCREVEVPKLGERVWVPRHIVRIDHRSTHGWQVRFQKPSVWFADAGESPSAVKASLALAKRHLRSIWVEIPKQTSRGKARSSNGMAGIREVRDTRNKSIYHYIEYAPPDRVGVPRRFYFGNSNTATPGRRKAALEKAKKCRQAWLASNPVPIR